jgi:hypothetical protein
MSALLAFALIGFAAIVTRWWAPPAVASRSTRAFESRWTPLLIGAITAVVAGWMWGSLDPVTPIHDEASYLLQAKIFAGFHWTAPGRPLPQFFEQYHVFVTPLLVSKYPPGHPLVMVPGIWLGLPTLMPTLCIGATGSLLFLLAKRLANPLVALATWLIWVTAPGVLMLLPSYLSESTSGLLWLLGWWALLEWRETGSRNWLLALAACVGWGALTRPLTSLVYAIPIGVVLLPRLIRERSWGDLGWAAAVGGATLAIIVLWCLHTTGTPFRTPYALYSQVYFPDDVMGFGVSGKLPLRHLSADMQHFNAWVHAVHAIHTVPNLPRQLAARLVGIGGDMWAGWRLALIPMAILGLLGSSAELAFALASAGILVLGYLSFAHGASWTVYYLEIQPVLAFVTALGLWRFVCLVASGGSALRSLAPPQLAPRGTASLLLAVLLLAPGFAVTMHDVRAERIAWGAYHAAFRKAVQHLPGDRIIVFVRYAPTHSPHLSLITNEPDLARARVWTVYDYGPDDLRLTRLAPDRVPYLFDESRHLIAPLDTGRLAAELAAREGPVESRSETRTP